MCTPPERKRKTSILHNVYTSYKKRKNMYCIMCVPPTRERERETEHVQPLSQITCLLRRSSSPAVLAGSPLQAVLVVAGGPGRPSSSPVVLALAGRPGRPSSSPVAASNGATPLVINGGSKIVYRSSKNKTRWKQKVRHRFQAKTQHTTRWKQKKRWKHRLQQKHNMMEAKWDAGSSKTNSEVNNSKGRL